MRRVMILTLVFVTVCLHNCLGGKAQCQHGGKLSETTPFFDKDNTLIVSLPCRYKVANIACGGDQTEIYAENSVDDSFYPVAYMVGVEVVVTTVNEDGGTSVQTLTITNDTLKRYMDKKEFDESPWHWSSTGSQTDSSKKITGYYDNEEKVAVVEVGKLIVEFMYNSPDQFRFPSRPTLKITCAKKPLKAFEGFPQTICGSLNNTHDDILAIDKELTVDLHHRQPLSIFRNDYIMFTKQQVQQRTPLCQEASTIVNTGCRRNLGDVMYDCHTMTTGLDYSHYGRCLSNGRSARIDYFKVYVTCLRVLCEAEGYKSKETCDVLRQVSDKCGDLFWAHRQISEFLSLAQCPSNTSSEDTTSSKRKLVDYYPNESKDTCTVADREVVGYWNTTILGTYRGFGRHLSLRVNLPCRYKVADIKCSGKNTVIYGDHSLDKQGLSYLSGVEVTTTTTNQDGDVIRQTNEITNRRLKKYIRKAKFNKSPWIWSYTGANKPGRKERLTGGFDQTTKSAVLKYHDLTVTYNYIDPKVKDRPIRDLLSIHCGEKKFKANEEFPETICGGPKELYFLDISDVWGKSLTYDKRHHYNLPADVGILARQNVTQSNKLCREIRAIVNSNCSDLGDKLYECYMFTQPESEVYWSFYGPCSRKHSIDNSEVLAACLRVLCDREGARSSNRTCSILQSVENACGEASRENPDLPPHMYMTELLARAKCPTGPKTTPKTTT